MRRFFSFLLLAPALISLFSGDCAAETVQLGSYPAPVMEMKEQVTDWLKGEGFRVSRENFEQGTVVLEAARARKRVRIGIEPRSPLASSLFLEGMAGPGGDRAVAARLKEYLDANAAASGARAGTVSPPLPGGVESREGAVFCLRASVSGSPMGFSGFAVDRRGYLVSTAHDLNGVRWVVVGSGTGDEARGEVVWRDVRRDLSLIKVGRTLHSIVSIGEGLSSPRVGERIFLLSCPAGSRGAMAAGLIGDPPAMVNGQPLWQVDMPVSPGDSGSPVFDAEGRLVGMVKGRYRGTLRRGFLIPLDTIRDFLGKGGL